jgi:hypothetical protein
MTAVEQFERLIEKLPGEEFQEHAAWMDLRRPLLGREPQFQ